MILSYLLHGDVPEWLLGNTRNLVLLLVQNIPLSSSPAIFVMSVCWSLADTCELRGTSKRRQGRKLRADFTLYRLISIHLCPDQSSVLLHMHLCPSR